MTDTRYLAPVADDTAAPKRTHLRRYLIVLAAVVVVIVLVAWLIAFSSVFGVRSVDVRGTQLLTPAQVRAAAGIADGTPLVRVDTADVTRRVKRLSDVASAQVSTSFPSTVTITIVERHPVGFFRSHGRVVLVDRFGARYRSVNSAPDGLPRFVLTTGPASAATRSAVARVAASLPASLRQRINSIQAQDPNTITLVLPHGKIVRWGNAQRNADKAQILPPLLHRSTSVVDVSDPDQPFTR